MINIKKFAIHFLLLFVSFCYLSCSENIKQNNRENSNKEILEDETLTFIETNTNPTISRNILEKLIVSSYVEQTNDSLVSYIQLIEESPKVIAVITAPVEGGTDSWELGEIVFVDSAYKSYHFNILKSGHSDNPILWTLKFKLTDRGLIELLLTDDSYNESIRYLSDTPDLYTSQEENNDYFQGDYIGLDSIYKVIPAKMSYEVISPNGKTEYYFYENSTDSSSNYSNEGGTKTFIMSLGHNTGVLINGNSQFSIQRKIFN